MQVIPLSSYLHVHKKKKKKKKTNKKKTWAFRIFSHILKQAMVLSTKPLKPFIVDSIVFKTSVCCFFFHVVNKRQ